MCSESMMAAQMIEACRRHGVAGTASRAGLQLKVGVITE